MILDLEEKCGAGIAAILQRLADGTWRLNDVRETIRLGLIGGGMSPEKAMAAVKNHVDENPLASSVLIAYAVIEAALVPPRGDDVGKELPAEVMQAGFITPMDASDVRKS
ncbi:hypothetical protein X566_15575 [Afipia sp. P52-10]|nr:hypothetical protein X566_15575 [Afipia sp. P52-10]